MLCGTNNSTPAPKRLWQKSYTLLEEMLRSMTRSGWKISKGAERRVNRPWRPAQFEAIAVTERLIGNAYLVLSLVGGKWYM